MAKEKRVNKTEEQLIAETKAKETTNRLRLKARDEFYPHLLATAKNVEEGKTLSMAYYLAIEQAFMKLKRTMTVKELGLREMLNQSEEADKWNKFFDMFENETIENMSTVVQGIPDVIDGFIRMEMKDRPLDSLKTYFLDEDK